MQVEIEIFKNGKWIIETRYYNIVKSLDSFDLKDIPNLRRNARVINKI